MMTRLNFFILIVLNLLVFLTTTEQKSISPDSKRLYHDIVSGHGLYYGFDKFNELDNSNFKSVVFNKSVSKVWLIEFYNSWCGHCHRFAPTWKAFAADIYGWRDVISISAVDCAKNENNQLCIDFEIDYYPVVRLLPPNSSETFVGIDFNKDTVEAMRHAVISELKNIQSEQSKITGPNLMPYNGITLEGLWTNVPPETIYTCIIIEPINSFVGAELALDLYKDKKVQVRSILNDNITIKNLINYNLDTGLSIYVINRDLKFLKFFPESMNRTSLIKGLMDFYNERGFNLTVDLPSTYIVSEIDVDISDVLVMQAINEKIKEKLKTKQLSTIVFQSDLEEALSYSLKNEIPLHRNITGESLAALSKYLKVLINYFPVSAQGVTLLTRIHDEVIKNKTQVKGKDFRESVKKFETELHPVFLAKQGWLGCRGSKLEYRGYPCGLWTIFHTLTVSAAMKNQRENLESDLKGSEVLDAVAGYVRYFFTCSDCAQHFGQMTQTIAGNVTTYEDAVMWLWAAHNTVNKRLAGDQTEDPQHKKVQFPTPESCPQCKDENGSYKHESVLYFLKNMYTNISYLQLNDIQTTLKQVENSSHYEFIFICSVAILITICIIFVLKKKCQRKT